MSLTDAPVLHSQSPNEAVDAPDRRDGSIYEYGAELKLALEVALYTGRPLLLRGDPGTGKSSFAAYVARSLGWRYYEHVVTARTRAEDLLWRFDAVRRLSDAQVRSGSNSVELNDFDYVEPGEIWWALDRQSAFARGAEDPGEGPASQATEPFASMNATRNADHAVVLIDEIDKADPDVPNNLLVPLGSSQFRVRETGTLVRAAPAPETSAATSAAPTRARHLFILTTNEERELPAAFLRRCIVHVLEHPDAAGLVEIAKLHFDPLEGAALELAQEIATAFDTVSREKPKDGSRAPSTAEYLDAVRACLALGVEQGSQAWQTVESVAVRKHAPGGKRSR